MSTATAATDLVNAALLGTDRRPVPAPDGTDPAVWLLEAAARRRAATLVAAATRRVPLPPAAAPAPDRARPPAPAREVLDEILLVTGSEPVNLWLRAALDAGFGLAPEHWAALLDRARRANDLDRRRLGAALGARGLWFARQNPAWAAVVRSLEVAADEAAERDPTLSAAEAAAALQALTASTPQVGGARALGRRVGTRLPVNAYDALARLRSQPLDEPARVGLAAAEEVLRLRLHLAATFDPERHP